MKIITILCALMFLSCACHTEQMQKPTWDLVSGESAQFAKLSVVWGGAVSPEFIRTEITIDSNKEISLIMQSYAASEVKSECSGKATLNEQDYQKIVSMVSSIDLFHYRPPTDCQPLIGTQGVAVTYTRNDGSSGSFDTVCELEQKIDDLLYSVDATAQKYITGCSMETLMQGEGTETSGTTS